MTRGDQVTKAVKMRDMELLAQYRDQLCQNPRLTYLFFELTNACNLSCLHCGSHAGPHNHTYLPVESVKTVIDQVSAELSPKGIMVCLSGGEPMLHPHFYEIAAYAKQSGFTCGVTSNGTLIDPAAAQKFMDAGIDSISFSLDGLADTHDWFRNRPGSFDQTVQGIRNLLNASRGRMVTQVTTVIHRNNIHQLDGMFELVSGLGVDSWRVINLEPIGRTLDHQDLLLDARQFEYLLSYIREKRYSAKVQMDVTYGCSHYLTEPMERTVRDHYFICGSGIMVASVLCNGDIYSCLDIERIPELVQGNILCDNFVDVWKHRFEAFRRDRSGDNDMCRQCSDRAYCRGDAAHTWDYQAKQPLLCVKQLLSEGRSCV